MIEFVKRGGVDIPPPQKIHKTFDTSSAIIHSTSSIYQPALILGNVNGVMSLAIFNIIHEPRANLQHKCIVF